MTLDDVLKKVETERVCKLSWKEFHALFPGHTLTKDEMQFKTAFAEAGGGKLYNPRGSSQHDKLMKFIDENRLNYSQLDGLPTFYRGRIDQP